jgi:hypothetical protein
MPEACPHCRARVRPQRLHGQYEVVCRCNRLVVWPDDRQQSTCECGRIVVVVSAAATSGAAEPFRVAGGPK